MTMFKKIFTVLSFTIFCFSAKAQSPGAILDVQHYTFSMQLTDADNVINGQADISVKFLKKTQSFKIDLVKKNSTGKGMLVSMVTEDKQDLKFKQDSDAINITAVAEAGSEHTYHIVYQGVPVDGLIISTNKFGHRTFFGDNWPNRAHNWLPCVDEPADKATVDFIITTPDHYQVVANGSIVSETPLPDNQKITHWKETAPLPTKVMVIGVADFAVDHTGDVKNIPVYTYVFPENKDVGFNGYAVAKEILAYYIEKVGPYAYEKLANVQSKTIFGGMENASCIFYFENSVGDKGIEELMAHEIAHQWFGDAASEKNFSHLWLSEGFATYMTNVYLEHKYGVDTLKKRLEADRQTVLDFEKSRKTAVVDTTVHNNYMVLLNANSYQKGGWILHMLRRKLGDTAYWKGIRSYYAKYENGNANTNDLRTELEKASGQNLESFFKKWLYSPGTPHLNITYNYNTDKKIVDLTITQKQAALFNFPLEVSVGGDMHTVIVKDKVTHVQFVVKQTSAPLAVDPNVNLLADFEVKEQIQ